MKRAILMGGVIVCALSYTVTIAGDRTLFEDASNRLLDTRPLMRTIGEYCVGQAQERLTRVLRADAEAVRTGDLENSLQVFEVSDLSVTFGSNLRYAAQVHHGGTIRPKSGKALAIPLLPQLQREQVWPRDLDPGHELLQFQPITSSKPNVFALLINPERELTGRQRTPRGTVPGLPTGPLYALAYWVTQPARPYLYIDDHDMRVIREEIWPAWLRGRGG